MSKPSSSATMAVAAQGISDQDTVESLDEIGWRGGQSNIDAYGHEAVANPRTGFNGAIH
jgi:hypothetical protein